MKANTHLKETQNRYVASLKAGSEISFREFCHQENQKVLAERIQAIRNKSKKPIQN